MKESEYKWRKVSTSKGKCVLVEVGALISWCIYSYRIVMLLVPYMWASMTFLPRTRSKYMKPAPSEGKRVRASRESDTRFFNQSQSEVKQTSVKSELLSTLHWKPLYFVFVVIGWGDYFGFRLTTLVWKAFWHTKLGRNSPVTKSRQFTERTEGGWALGKASFKLIWGKRLWSLSYSAGI